MNFRRVYTFCALVTAFLLPSCFYQLTLVATALMAVCFIIDKQLRDLKSLREPAVFLPLLMYGYILAGFFFSNNRGEALSSLSVYLPFILYPVFVGCSRAIDDGLVRKAETVFLFSTSIFLAIALGYAVYDILITGRQSLMISDGEYSKYKSFGLTRIFDNWHPTYVAMFANYAIYIAAEKILALWPKQKKVAVGYLSLIVFLSICVLLLDSVTGIFIYILIILYVVALHLGIFRQSPSKKIIFLACSFLLLLYIVFFNPFGNEKIGRIQTNGLNVTDQYTQRSILTIRLAKWKVHGDVINRNFLFGTTVGDIKDVREKAYIQDGYLDLAKHNYNAHNQYIDVFARYGLIGFLLFFSLLLVPLLSNPLQNFTVFTLIAMISFTTESILERQQGLLYFLFFYSLYTCRGLKKNYSPG